MKRHSIATLLATAAIFGTLGFSLTCLGQTKDDIDLVEVLKMKARELVRTGRPDAARKLLEKAESIRDASEQETADAATEGEHSHDGHDHRPQVDARQQAQASLDRLIDAAAQARIRGDRRALEEIQRDLQQHARMLIEIEIDARVERKQREGDHRRDEHPHGHDEHAHGHNEHAHGHDEHAHGHDEHAHGHDEHAHGHDEHAHEGHEHDDGMRRNHEEARSIERKVDSINREIHELQIATRNPAKRDYLHKMEAEIRELTELRERLIHELRRLHGDHEIDREHNGHARDLHEAVDTLRRRLDGLQGHSREMEEAIRELQQQVRELARRDRR